MTDIPDDTPLSSLTAEQILSFIKDKRPDLDFVPVGSGGVFRAINAVAPGAIAEESIEAMGGQWQTSVPRRPKKIIAFRHGDDTGAGLTHRGYQQIERLCTVLKDHVSSDDRVLLLSSGYGRAIVSADIVANEVVPNAVRRREELYDDDDFDSIGEVIAVAFGWGPSNGNAKFDVVILSTHAPVVRRLPDYVGFGPKCEGRHGTGWILNMDTGVFQDLE